MWEVIDGIATPEIQQKHEQLMLIDAEYAAEYQQYALLDQQLYKLDLEIPSMRFTENVIDDVLHIKKSEKKKDWTPVIFLSAMVALSALVAVIFSTFSTSSNSVINNNTEGFLSFVSNPLVINSFLVLNIILILLIVDRKVLKPFFDKKIK